MKHEELLLARSTWEMIRFKVPRRILVYTEIIPVNNMNKYWKLGLSNDKSPSIKMSSDSLASLASTTPIVDVERNEIDEQQIHVEWLKLKKDGEKNNVILYLHGGAFCLCSSAFHRPVTYKLVDYTGFDLCSVDYRLTPEHAFPCALQDAVNVYFNLIHDKGYKASQIHIAGDSAGGCLSIALCLYLRDHKFPLPKSVYVMSPWVDLTCSSESWSRNANSDYLVEFSQMKEMSPAYLYGKDLLEHPYVSPLFADTLRGLPPMLIQCGSIEILHDEIIEFHAKLTKDNDNSPLGQYTLEMYENMPHVFQLFPCFSERKKAFESASKFFKLNKYECFSALRSQVQRTGTIFNSSVEDLEHLLDPSIFKEMALDLCAAGETKEIKECYLMFKEVLELQKITQLQKREISQMHTDDHMNLKQLSKKIVEVKPEAFNIDPLITFEIECNQLLEQKIKLTENEDRNEDDLMLEGSTLVTRCPYTTMTIREAMTNSCGHTYSSEGVNSALVHNPNGLVCPVTGCSRIVTRGTLKRNQEYDRKISRLRIMELLREKPNQ
ncbi:Lipase, GDXG domain-containing protein [Rozella allomycis CSF55]|uniref:Lipase, GDXG domain-containing protein n=1 Tax=Rozella allomycis (strain CSF55) TaxID=988480 RepID=A0A075AN35_ROZAC|nr:Lipase, GDXG domain-containing protein [Rozella allomycis CSF55]|eukprot:EPZ31128.1 Lipase, GDXG domain-containing protein [Rozella allomycis CSF55]